MSAPDLPLLQPFPNGTPSDAEHQADRDAAHAAVMADWERRNRCLCPPFRECACGAADDPFGDQRDDEAVSR